MDDAVSSAVLAVDGGGTRCRMVYDNGRTRLVVESGPANVSTDFDAAVAEFLRALELMSGETGVSQDVLVATPTFVGVAGITGPAIATQLERALPFKHLRIEDDRPASLRGSLGDRDGAVAHCGTGSFFASQISGQVRLAGAWGSVLGDEASAHWIGRAALALTLESADGRADPSALADEMLLEFTDTAGIVRFAAAARPSEFGALAPLVTRLARENDTLALQIMRSGAAEIARSLPRIGWTPGLAICLTGGIGPEFRPYLPDPMQDAIVPPDGQPLDGAVALARDFAEEIAHGRS